MIRSPTVFVLGAGASAEVGMPLGVDLTDQIANALNFRAGGHSPAKELVRGAISAAAAAMKPYVRTREEALFSRAVQASAGLATSPSIDVYIDNHASDEACALVGKIGIAACLVEAERISTLREDAKGAVNVGRLKDTWFARLFNVMAGGIRASSIHEMFANVAFVNFNYDRCLEQYFRHAIASRFHTSVEEASEIVNQHCRIVHPYGSLGPLTGSSENIGFGAHLHPQYGHEVDAIRRMAERLLTFTESKAARAQEAKDLLKGANRAVFLGFAFHPQNVELLASTSTEVVDFRATAMGASPSNRREIRRHIGRILSMRTGATDENHLHNGTCSKLIVDEELYLSR